MSKIEELNGALADLQASSSDVGGLSGGLGGWAHYGQFAPPKASRRRELRR